MTSDEDKVQFELDSMDLLISRASAIALTLFLFHIPTSIMDLIQLEIPFLVAYAGKVPMVMLSLTILFAGDKQWLSRHLRLVLCLLLMSMLYSVYVKSVQYGDHYTMILVAMIICMVSAYLIPWGLRYQIVVSVTALGIIAVSMSDQRSNQEIVFFNREILVAVCVCLFSNVQAYISGTQRYADWQHKHAVQRNDYLFRQLAEHSSDIVFIWNADLSIEYVSPAFERYTGREVSEVLNTPLNVSDLIEQEQVNEYRLATQAVLDGHQRRMDLRVVHANGTEAFLEAWGSPIFNPDGKVDRAISVWRDVTARSAKEKSLEHQAAQDSLTKTYNQRHFRELASEEIKKSLEFGTALSLVYIDIDGFRKIVEQHGLTAGDQVIIEVTERCRKRLGNTPVMGRLGGDSLLILLPQLRLEDGLRIAADLTSGVAAEMILIDDALLPVTVCAGVAAYDPASGETFDELLENAAQALYRSKRYGRNHVTAWPFAETTSKVS